MSSLEMLKRQTWSLRFAQEMLEGVKAPVAGVRAGEIAYRNAAFRRLFGEGRDAASVFPPEVCARLQSDVKDIEVVREGGTTFELRALRVGEAVLGVLVTVLRHRRAAKAGPPLLEARLKCRGMTGDELIRDLARTLRQSGRPRRLRIVVDDLSQLDGPVGRFLVRLSRLLRSLELPATLVDGSGCARAALERVGTVPFLVIEN